MPEQRRRVPPDRGDRAAGHDRQHGAAGGVRGARPDRLSHGRLLFGALAQMLSRPRAGGLRWRQYRRPRSAATMRSGKPFIYVDLPAPPGAAGRSPMARRQHHMFANMASLDRGDRGRAADPGPGVRFVPDTMGAGTVPRRRALLPRRPHPGRGHPAGPRRPPRLPALTGCMAAGRRARDELCSPRTAATARCRRSSITLKQRRRLPPGVPGGGGWGDPLARDPAAVWRICAERPGSVAAARARLRRRIPPTGRGRRGHRALRAEAAARRLPAVARERSGMSWRVIGVDIGGTFTDLVRLADGGGAATKKVSSTRR